MHKNIETRTPTEADWDAIGDRATETDKPGRVLTFENASARDFAMSVLDAVDAKLVSIGERELYVGEKALVTA